jgi:hypothetical protein
MLLKKRKTRAHFFLGFRFCCFFFEFFELTKFKDCTCYCKSLRYIHTEGFPLLFEMLFGLPSGCWIKEAASETDLQPAPLAANVFFSFIVIKR